MPKESVAFLIFSGRNRNNSIRFNFWQKLELYNSLYVLSDLAIQWVVCLDFQGILEVVPCTKLEVTLHLTSIHIQYDITSTSC